MDTPVLYDLQKITLICVKTRCRLEDFPKVMTDRTDERMSAFLDNDYDIWTVSSSLYIFVCPSEISLS